VKDYCREFIAFMFSNVGIIGLVVGYTIGGAFVFSAIEGGDLPSANAKLLQLRNSTALRLWDLSCCGLNVFSEVGPSSLSPHLPLSHQNYHLLWMPPI
jgi:hypothetical protein